MRKVFVMGINVDVEYEIEPGQKETRIEPGWDARVILENIVIGGEDFGDNLERYFNPKFLYEIKEEILSDEADEHESRIAEDRVEREQYNYELRREAGWR